MTSPKSDMSVQYIHNVYSMDKTKLADTSGAKRGANGQKAANAKAPKAAKASSAKAAPVK